MRFLLVDEWKNGKVNYCYTINNRGEIGIEKIQNPRITRKKVQVVKVTLDSGEEIICTPDHKYLLRDGSYVEAKDLNTKMSLMPFKRKISKSKALFRRFIKS